MQIKLFDTLANKIISEMNVAGGAISVFGTVDSGSTGNQFPSQNDNAYAPGDTRLPKILGGKIGKKGKGKKKTMRQQEILLQRRFLPKGM